MPLSKQPAGGNVSPATIGLDFRRMSVLTKFLQQFPNNITAAVSAWIADAKNNGYGLYVPAGTYDLDVPADIINWVGGFELIGEGRSRTILRQSAQWAAQTYYAFDTTGCTINVGTNVLNVPAASIAAFQDALARCPAGPTIYIYGCLVNPASGLPNDRFVTTYTQIVGNTLILTDQVAANGGAGYGYVRVTPPALLNLQGVEQSQIHGITIEGRGGGAGVAQLWAGIRCGAVPGNTPPVSVPQRNHFFDLSIGTACTGIELFGARDGNNDLSIIENANLANITKFGVDMLDSQEYDWTCRNITSYGDADWETAKVCSINAGTNVLNCPSAPFLPFHKGTLVEVAGAGFGGGVLVGLVTRFVSTSQVELNVNASVGVAGAAALRIGAQAGYHMGGPLGGGNVTVRGGIFNGHWLRAAMLDESFNGGCVELADGRDEGCRALYEQPLNGGISRPMLIEDYTFAQGAVIAERPVLAVTAGPFAMKNAVLGQRAGGTSDMTITISPTSVTDFVASFDNVHINTEMPREEVFSRWDSTSGRSQAYRPTAARQVRIYDNVGNLIEYIDDEIRNEEAVTTVTQPLASARVRLTWGNNQSPDFSALMPNLRVAYDASRDTAPPLNKKYLAGANDFITSIPDIVGANDATRQFTVGSAVSKPPELQAMGPNGRRGWRFAFGRALYIPALALAGMTEAEGFQVFQVISRGGGSYTLGASSAGGASVHHPYTNDVWYDDTFRDFRLNSAALSADLLNQIIIVNYISRATANPGDFTVTLNGVAVINGGPGTAFQVPTHPMLGAGSNNLAGNAPGADGDVVIGCHYISDTVLPVADRARVIDWLRQYWGEGTAAP